LSPEAPEVGFERLVRHVDVPIFIVTTVGADGERSGCLIGFTTQCSIHPPRFLACLSVLNHTHGVAETADVLAVHLVPEASRPLAELFGGETGDEIDKFERCAWTPGPRGVPLLDDCPTWFVGRVLDRVRTLGDHTGYVLEPIEASGAEAGPYLDYRSVRSIEPGHPE
jgi:flavin reductase (DIM6/NTAB) family NADH-FMN oxidoreductase RutF